MTENQAYEVLFQPLGLPCGAILKNRIAKAAMSDSLGDGRGNPTEAQRRLYACWSDGGLGLSIVGEVQCSSEYPEKPGNLVLDINSNLSAFSKLAREGARNRSQLWLQLGHAGAMSHAPISVPRGPSAIDVPGLKCAGMNRQEILDLPALYAKTATMSKELGFGGVEIHAAHGFLLSQFLSPLFNQRNDSYGGSIENRTRLLLEILEEVRFAVGASYPIGLKINSTDELEGGLSSIDALKVISRLDNTNLDLIDISGGTYFPGAKSASDSAGRGPYFRKFAEQARQHTTIPLMLTGGVKNLRQAVEIISSGDADIVGLGRALALYPDLPNQWATGSNSQPEFPRFSSTPEGGVTAWYTMRLVELGEGQEPGENGDIHRALKVYLDRDVERAEIWYTHFKAS